MAGVIHSIAPDIPLNAKFRVHCTYDPLLTREGVDPELFSNIFDINGCDASCYWNPDGILSSYLNEMAAYDMLSSFKTAPVFNSENHILNDGFKYDYDPGCAAHTAMILWQGAVHRCSATTIWLWERGLYELFAYRPDCMEAVSVTALNLNRLSKEVTALQNITPKIAILYATPAFTHSLDTYKTTLKAAYRALSLSGIPVGFISEKQLSTGALKTLKAVVIPQTAAVHSATIMALAKFAESGGKTIVVASGIVFTKDEHLISFDETVLKKRAALFAESTTITPKRDGASFQQFKKRILNTVTRIGIAPCARLLDAATGEPPVGVEWRLAKLNGYAILNIANYTMKTVTLRIADENLSMAAAKELISNKQIECRNLKIPRLGTILLKIPF
jgi:hypothetical protein